MRHPVPTRGSRDRGPRGVMPGRAKRAQRGAALVTAVLVAALAAVMVSGMLWQQWGNISREQTARDAAQARWILRGALDWARLILREQARTSSVDALSQPWAVPLADSELATFLGGGVATLDHAWLSGRIDDAQSRFNLANVVVGGTVSPTGLAVLQRLCARVGVDPGVAEAIGGGIAASANGSTLGMRSLQDLARISPSVARALPALAPYVTLLPTPTTVNANTAGATVLAAVLDLPQDTAAGLVSARNIAYFKSRADVQTALGAEGTHVDTRGIDVSSGYFEAYARVRLGGFAYAQRALIQRIGLITVVLRVQQVPPWTPMIPHAAQ